MTHSCHKAASLNLTRQRFNVRCLLVDLLLFLGFTRSTCWLAYKDPYNTDVPSSISVYCKYIYMFGGSLSFALMLHMPKRHWVWLRSSDLRCPVPGFRCYSKVFLSRHMRQSVDVCGDLCYVFWVSVWMNL